MQLITATAKRGVGSYLNLGELLLGATFSTGTRHFFRAQRQTDLADYFCRQCAHKVPAASLSRTW
eukprot:scaffold172609_cov14-Tisochrysis_lutea.AAC.1